MSEERMNDLDLLGPPRSCRPLPGWLWVGWVLVLLAIVLAGVVLKVAL